MGNCRGNSDLPVFFRYRFYGSNFYRLVYIQSELSGRQREGPPVSDLPVMKSYQSSPLFKFGIHILVAVPKLPTKTK